MINLNTTATLTNRTAPTAPTATNPNCDYIPTFKILEIYKSLLCEGSNAGIKSLNIVFTPHRPGRRQSVFKGDICSFLAKYGEAVKTAERDACAIILDCNNIETPLWLFLSNLRFAEKLSNDAKVVIKTNGANSAELTKITGNDVTFLITPKQSSDLDCIDFNRLCGAVDLMIPFNANNCCFAENCLDVLVRKQPLFNIKKLNVYLSPTDEKAIEDTFCYLRASSGYWKQMLGVPLKANLLNQKLFKSFKSL